MRRRTATPTAIATATATTSGAKSIMANHERTGNLNIWWFPKDFSQSRFGEYQQSGTNSCTLISLLLADKIAREDRGFLRYPTELPRRAFTIFSAAINEGNAAYNHAFGPASLAVPASKSPRHNLSIPDAMRMLSSANHRFHLHEWFFTHLHAERNKANYVRTVSAQLAQIFNVGMELLRQPNVKNPPNFLFAALISDSRTVCFVFELSVGVVSLFDSHQHGRQAGALIAQSLHDNLCELIFWFVHMQYDIYSSQPQLYEISFLTANEYGLPLPKKFSEESRSVERVENNSH